MSVCTTTRETWDNVNVEIVNIYNENSFSRMMLATFCMILFIACGFWCICASCELRKEEENSYHRDKDFEKDEVNPSRSNAGSEV